jgi:hypothetical protein
MKWIFLLLLTPLLLQAADEQVNWSKPVKGLRARLFISPNRDPDSDHTYQIYLQFENVGVLGSDGTISREETFQFDQGELALDVANVSGQGLPPHPGWTIHMSPKPPGAVDEPFAGYNLSVPPGGNLAFPIGYISGTGTEHIYCSPLFTWDLPATGTGTYYLSGTFSFSLKNAWPNVPAGTHPTGRDWGIRLNWEGTLVLPPVQVPAH